MFDLSKDEIKDIRDRTMEIHCHIVTLSQKCSGGYSFSGYGIIKSNKFGDLWLEFICTETNAQAPFPRTIPEDPLNEDEYLQMKATAISGREYLSAGLRMELPIVSHPANPTCYQIHLRRVRIHQEVPQKYSHIFKYKNALTLEFHEKVVIPYNVSNTEESSLGTKSFAWNQTKIETDLYTLNIIDHKEYTECVILSDTLERTQLEDAIFFYVGFASGVFPQPYVISYRHDLTYDITINSYGHHKSHLTIPAPTSSYVSDSDGRRDRMDELHFDLFREMQSLLMSNKPVFSSIYSNWSRVWHSYHNREQNVPKLTLTVSIEGILNDVFIPLLKEWSTNPAFNAEKRKIQEILREIEGIDAHHKKTLIESVDRWGNIHPKKALQLLHSEFGLIEDYEVKAWDKLRNTVAHPRTKALTASKQKAQEVEYLQCLSLFYKLILIRLKFRGAFFDFSRPYDGTFVMFDHNNFFD